MDDIPSLTGAIEAGNLLISSISHHPALVEHAILKKGETAMEVDNCDLLDQIDLANKYVAEVDDRIKIIFRSVRKSYSQRFPELKVSDPMQYLLTAQLLANKPERITEDDDIKNKLSEVLDPKMHLLVTMTAATTRGIKIEPDEMNLIIKACSTAVHMRDLRAKLLGFVEKNMSSIAPNLSVIVGAPIAAKLMGLAGGLSRLATMPACNVPILGSHRVSVIETNVNMPPPHTGLVYDCDLIQRIPIEDSKDLRKKAVKWVANKCVLAARCDASQSDSNCQAGKLFRDKIESLISKELEPPPKKAARPLPKPIEKSGKRRGGKRSRRTNERYMKTELRKAANRINFGDVGDDAYQNDLGFGRSQLNAIHKLHGPQINDKTKIRLSKAAQKKLAKAQAKTRNPEGITLTAQKQCLEIYNPKAKESYGAGTSGESSNYFSNTAGFLNVKKEEK